MSGIWEGFVSSKAKDLGAVTRAEIGPLVEAFVANDKQRFRQGLPLVRLAKDHPQETCTFIRRTLDLRRKHGSDWDQVLQYFLDRNAAFRSVFVSVSSEDPEVVTATHELLDRDLESVRSKNAEACRLLGALVATEHLFDGDYSRSTMRLWLQNLKSSSRWEEFSKAAASELANETRAPFWPMGKAHMDYSSRLERLRARHHDLTQLGKRLDKEIEDGPPRPYAGWAKERRALASKALADLASELSCLGLVRSAIVCPACGASQEPESDFCDQCKHSLGGLRQGVVFSSSAQPVEDFPLLFMVFLICGGVLLATIVFLTGR